MFKSRSVKIVQAFGLALGLSLLSGLSNVSRVDASTLTSYGDGSNTLDTATGLLWLDVSLSINRSFNDVSAELGIGGDYEGYHYADIADLSLLFTNAGLPHPIFQVVTPVIAADFEDFVDLLGFTFSSSHYYYTYGLQSSVGGALVYLQYEDDGRVAALANTSWVTFDPNTQVADLGSFLVRDAPLSAVPLPAALPLLAAGLGAMGFMGWRKKRKAAHA